MQLISFSNTGLSVNRNSGAHTSVTSYTRRRSEAGGGREGELFLQPLLCRPPCTLNLSSLEVARASSVSTFVLVSIEHEYMVV